MPTWVQLVYLACAVCFILALKGLSSPRTARRGNLIGAAGAAIALVTTFLSTDLDNLALILIAMVVGAASTRASATAGLDAAYPADVIVNGFGAELPAPLLARLSRREAGKLHGRRGFLACP